MACHKKPLKIDFLFDNFVSVVLKSTGLSLSDAAAASNKNPDFQGSF
jgi:hypothetical protein